MRRTIIAVIVANACWFGETSSQAQQQVLVETPFTTVMDGFWERTGINWGARGKGWFFNNGGPGPIPAFGGFDPNSQAQFGFGGRSRDTSFNFNMFAGQGSSRSIVNQTPSVMVPNGGTGNIFSGQMRPFVTGVIPVVGGQQPRPSTSLLQQRLSEMKQRGETLKPRSRTEPEEEYIPASSYNEPVEDDPPLLLGS